MTFFSPRNLFAATATCFAFASLTGCGASSDEPLEKKYTGQTLLVTQDASNADSLDLLADDFCGERSASITEDTGEFSNHQTYIVCDSRDENGRNGSLSANRRLVVLKEDIKARDLERSATSSCGGRGYTLSAGTAKYSNHRIIVTCGAPLPE